MFITSDQGSRLPAGADPQAMLTGGRLIGRLVCRVLGLGLLLAAAALWLMPGSSFATEVLLFKVFLAVCALTAGIGFFQAGAPRPARQVRVDMARRQFRLVQPEGALGQRLLRTCAFEDLSRVERGGPYLRLWDGEGRFLAELLIEEEAEMARLLAALRQAPRHCSQMRRTC